MEWIKKWIEENLASDDVMVWENNFFDEILTYVKKQNNPCTVEISKVMGSTSGALDVAGLKYWFERKESYITSKAFYVTADAFAIVVDMKAGSEMTGTEPGTMYFLLEKK